MNKWNSSTNYLSGQNVYYNSVPYLSLNNNTNSINIPVEFRTRNAEIGMQYTFSKNI